MLPLRRPTVWTIVVAIIAAITSPIWSVEVETLWLEKVRPYIVANAWSWVVTVLDFLSGFWGGIFVTLVILVIFDLSFRRLSKANDPVSTSGAEKQKAPRHERRRIYLPNAATRSQIITDWRDALTDRDGKYKDDRRQQIAVVLQLHGFSEYLRAETVDAVRLLSLQGRTLHEKWSGEERALNILKCEIDRVERERGEPQPVEAVTDKASEQPSGLKYAVIDTYKEFALWQAACLWADQWPRQPVPDGEPHSWLIRLKKAVAQYQLYTTLHVETHLKHLSVHTIQSLDHGRGSVPDIPDETVSTRDQYVEFASRVCSYPPFLFREER